MTHIEASKKRWVKSVLIITPKQKTKIVPKKMCWKVNKKKFNSFRSILHGAKNRFDPEKQ
jgi:hypothetical protein